MNNPIVKCTILWADDDPDDLMVMREVMQEIDARCNIVEVENGRKAMAYLHTMKLQETFPNLIVLDMNMPVMSGRETLAAIKADPVLTTIPVVIFTTSNSDLDRIFCRHYGVEMLTKPLTFAGTRQVMRELFKFCRCY